MLRACVKRRAERAARTPLERIARRVNIVVRSVMYFFEGLLSV